MQLKGQLNPKIIEQSRLTHENGISKKEEIEQNKELERVSDWIAKFKKIKKEYLDIVERRDNLDLKARNKRRQIQQLHDNAIEGIQTSVNQTWKAITKKENDNDGIVIFAQIKREGNIRVDYDYHLKMKLPWDETLQMRGRSSVGEKALASIIIRYALARKFGPDCGFIFFDDPQCNLDPLVENKLTD